MRIFVDGKLMSREDAKVSVFDHGFLYGDGVFEGIRVYEGNVFRLRPHLDRLYDSARSIDLTIPMGIDEMQQAVVDTVAANERRDAYVRLVVSRGEQVLGVLYLKDIVKAGIKERLADLRKMGIKSVMITGDNPLTAAAISAIVAVPSVQLEWTCRSPRISSTVTNFGSEPAFASTISPRSSRISGGM